MVKVLLLQLFESQRVVAIDEEPLEIVDTGHAFLAATKSGSVHHYSAGTECLLLHQFHTVNPNITALQYAPSSDCVVTLEKEAQQSAINVARVYYNWRLPALDEEIPQASPSSLDLTPIMDHKLVSSSAPSLGVFKLPIPSSITCITVCPSTGRIAAATKSSVSIWVLQHLHGENKNGEGKGKFHMEKILELDAPNVTRLALYEHYLGYTCCDDLEVKVLYLNITFEDPNSQPPTPSASEVLSALYDASNGSGGSDTSSSSSSTTLPSSSSAGNLSSLLKSSRDSIGSDGSFTNGVDSAPTTMTIPDEHFIELSFDAAGNPTHKFQLASVTSTAPPLPAPSSGHRHSVSGPPPTSSAGGPGVSGTGSGDPRDLGNDLFESLGPFTDSDHHANVNAEAGYSLASSLLLLHRRFSSDDQIHTLSFLPEYEQQNENEGQTPLAHPDSNSASFGAYNNYLPPIIAMRMLVSTARQGYMYKLSNPALLATYTYTAESLQCCASSCFLYVLTSVGLETWTLRTSDTYLPKSDPGVTTKLRINQTAETYDVFPPPCLIGLQPFISLQRIVVVGDAILLLSKMNTGPLAGGKSSALAAPIPQTKRKVTAPISTSPTNAISPGGGTYTAASTSVRSPKRADAWSLYVLHLTSLSLLYNEIISTAAAYDDSNPNVYYQLVLEGHFLLKSKLALPKPSYGTVGVGLAGLPSQLETGLLKGGLIVDAAVALNMNIEAQNNRALLRRSSTLLANFYVKQKEYMLAAMQYATSDRPIGEVVKLLNAQELTFYLDRVLFDPNMVHLLDEDVALADTILMHYHKYAPGRLPSVILDSSLSSYTQSLALQLLEMRDGKDAKDLFARALLYLDQGRVSDAMTVFKSINSYALVQFCISNPKLLAPVETTEPEQEGVPLLGKILRITSPWELLSIIVGLSLYIPVSVAVAMLRGSTADSDTMYYHPDLDLDNLLLKCFYEHLVVEAIKGKILNLKDYGEIIVNLATIYLDDIARHRGVDEPIFRAYPKKESERDSEKVIPSPGKATAIVVAEEGEDHAVLWRRFHLKTFLHRPAGTQWLDQLPPFDTHAKKGTFNKPATRNPYEFSDDDSDFDYTYLYVKKCQALLIAANQLQPYTDQTSSPAPLERFVQALASPTPLSPSHSPSTPNSSPIALPLTFSLQLLALPMANKLRAGLQQVVMYFPQVAFDYGKLFCRQPNQWADLLDELLRASLTTPNPSSSTSSTPTTPTSPAPTNTTNSPALPIPSALQASGNANVAAAVYAQIVEYLTAHVDPEAFLNLLPARGHLMYFLPYIEKAFCRHRAKALKSNISQFVALDLEGHVHATS